MSPQILEIEELASRTTGPNARKARSRTEAVGSRAPLQTVEVVFVDAVDDFAPFASELRDRLDTWNALPMAEERFDPVAAVAELLDGDPRFTWETGATRTAQGCPSLTIWIGLRLGDEE